MAVFFGFAYGVNTPCLSDEKADEQGVFLCVKRAVEAIEALVFSNFNKIRICYLCTKVN